MDFGSNSGSYVLELYLPQAEVIRVGALDAIPFEPGWYYYAGRAKRNLRQRVERHLRRDKKNRWHIDYLRAATSVQRVWITHSLAEEEIARAFTDSPHFAAITGFGAGDSSLPSHLFHAKRKVEAGNLVVIRDFFALRELSIGAGQSD